MATRSEGSADGSRSDADLDARLERLLGLCESVVADCLKMEVAATEIRAFIGTRPAAVPAHSG